MVMFGFLMLVETSTRTQRMADGLTLNMETLGYRTLNGDGLHSTMGVGIMTTPMDGDGFLGMNGGLRGFPGDKAEVNMDGLLWVLELA